MTPAFLRLLLVVAAVATAYLPSLGGGYIEFDDGWMIRDNAFVQSPSLSRLGAIWTDFSSETRLSLGAEYLPLRDSVLWLHGLLFGVSPFSLRVLNLLLYLTATLLCLLATRRLLGCHWIADAAAALFALHPVHAESVAWLVGTKDLLGLCFFWAAAALALDSRQRCIAWVVPLLVFAQLSKALFVVGPLLVGLLLSFPNVIALDDERRQKRLRMLGVALAACALASLLQIRVSSATTMLDSPQALSHGEALRVMGDTWWSYLRTAFLLTDLNIMPERSQNAGWTGSRVAGQAFVLVLTLGASIAWLKGRRRAIATAWLWFVSALLPVSQIAFVLQNHQADRYLVIAVYSLSLAFALGLSRVQRLVLEASRALSLTAPVVAFIVLGNAWMLSTYRALLFSDPVLLFEDAVKQTEHSPRAPYQLGLILEKRGASDEAVVAYRRALLRQHGGAEAARRATNNLARLHVKRGELSEAEAVLRRGLPLWPDDPKILGNLAEVVRLRGRTSESHALYLELLRRFPDDQERAERHERHFGAGRGSESAPPPVLLQREPDREP